MTLGLAVGWQIGMPELSPSAMGALEIWFLLLMGVLGTIGHFFFAQASRFAPSSIIAPMQYVEIAGAAILGYMVFGDFPSFVQWLGIGIIVAAGAYVFWRESRVR
jgi:drug/metabolite transporter (DMT)-like permease